MAKINFYFSLSRTKKIVFNFGADQLLADLIDVLTTICFDGGYIGVRCGGSSSIFHGIIGVLI